MKKILISLPLFAAALVLSGCSLGSIAPAKNTMLNATVIKTEDGGTTWNAKTKIDSQKTIEGVNVLSMAISPNNPDVVHIGTETDGLFATKDGGETWAQVAFADKAYGLVFDPQNSSTIYASGVFNKRAKIYKRLEEGQEWKEVYTEPAEGTIISSLAIDKNNSQILYAGTSEGVIIKTTDGGQTWSSLKKASGPIISIAFDKANDAHVFFGVFQIGVFETTDGGKNITDITAKIDTVGRISSVYTLTADPYYPGVVYVGTGSGIFSRAADGTWKSVNIIESSKAFPVRSISINPQNSKEIIYSSAKALYKSVDGGLTWATFQLDTTKEISVLLYDPTNAAKIYGGLRSF